jgi:hypothetical protein
MIVYLITEPSCNNTRYVCQDINDDVNAAHILKKRYPDKILLVRYEDLSLNPDSETRRILKFLGLEMKKSIKDFLDIHTKDPKKVNKLLQSQTMYNKSSEYGIPPVILPEPYNTFRDSSHNAFAWRVKSNYSAVEKIQKICSIPMKRLGYNLIPDERKLLDPNFDILKMTEEVELLRQVSYPLATGLEKIWTGIKTYFSSTQK